MVEYSQIYQYSDIKYKIPFSLPDHHTKTKPKWIAEEDTTSDVAPIPATCRQCKKPTNDGTFYSDLQASPASHRTVSREPNLQQMDESESVRGEVGIIDLSHAENGRRNNSTRIRHQDTEILRPKNYQSSSNRDKPTNAIVDRDKLRQETVIEIDPSSPTEKMFITSTDINKTSTPVSSRPSQKSKNRPPPPLALGTAIYTQASSSTTPTFSSSYISSIPRISAPSLSNRKYALGAPPLPVSISSSLDEMIAQAAQFNEINNQSLADVAKRNQSQINIDTHQQPSNQEVEQHPVQTSFDEHHPVQTSFTKQQPVKTSLSEQNIYSQTSTSSSAVPVALHANIDNISRDISQSSAHSSTDTLEIKIESEVDNSISDSFFMGKLQMEKIVKKIKLYKATNIINPCLFLIIVLNIFFFQKYILEIIEAIVHMTLYCLLIYDKENNAYGHL